MQDFIALLRGINVGGHKKIKMAELRSVLLKGGLQEVQTYIQSGNIVFKSAEEPSRLEGKIHRLIQDNFGFLVPVLVIEKVELQNILQHNPFDDTSEENQLFFSLLKSEPEEVVVKEFRKLYFPNEAFHFTAKCVYLNFTGGYRNAKLNNNFIENKLKVEATTRNLKTMQKLLEMSKD
ncbi:MAG: DUF1697 domain-containing protein [Bacteroidota bacterium]